MVLFNYTSKELTAKIVYYGPGLCGKTTNLQFIYDNLPAHVKKGKMLSLATKTDRTLFFDFLPIELGKIRGMKTRVQLYTVPGQVFYNSTRKLVLKGADGLVFVADSQQKMMESNAESYKNLEENLKEIGLKIEETPLVMQFNKRDLPHLTSVEEMNTHINRHNAPFYEAVATTGIGVEDTLKAVTKLVLNHLAAKYNLGVPPESRSAAAEEFEASLPARPLFPSTIPGEARGVTVAQDPGGMEIERIASPGSSRDPFSDSASLVEPDDVPEAEEDEGRGPGGSSLVFGDAPAASALPHAVTDDEREGMEEDLEIVDLGEVALPEELSVSSSFEELSGRAGPSEDLSDLLEELPAELGDESLPTLDEPVPDFSRRGAPLPAPPVRPSPESLAPGPLRPVIETTLEPRHGGNLPAPSRERAISPSDPLGIGDARSPDLPSPRAIQLGTVTPGREHEITVPLEMSVEGRKVRLNLKMTLTLTR